VEDCIKQKKQKDLGVRVGKMPALMETTEFCTSKTCCHNAVLGVCLLVIRNSPVKKSPHVGKIKLVMLFKCEYIYRFCFTFKDANILYLKLIYTLYWLKLWGFVIFCKMFLKKSLYCLPRMDLFDQKYN